MCSAGKTLLARAVANRTDACFIRVIGSELVQKYVGEGARMVRELFQMARSKKACLIFFDEIDAIGGARFDDGAGKSLYMTVFKSGWHTFEKAEIGLFSPLIVCPTLLFAYCGPITFTQNPVWWS